MTDTNRRDFLRKASSGAVAVGTVATVPELLLSVPASTTRNRAHASHAQNNVVFSPQITGPSPKSYCNHIPDSVTHGRCTRTRPSR